jgi:hypothetical protein
MHHLTTYYIQTTKTHYEVYRHHKTHSKKVISFDKLPFGIVKARDFINSLTVPAPIQAPNSSAHSLPPTP